MNKSLTAVSKSARVTGLALLLGLPAVTLRGDFILVLGNNPPYMYHDFNDHVQIKLYEALPLMRLASGSRQNLHVEQRLMEVLLQMQGHDYTLVRKGNEVVGVDPPGQNFPLYQRDHYRENKTRFKTVERFVSNRTVHW